MDFNPMILSILEEEGCTDTSDGCINRVAKYLTENGSETIDTEEFRNACYVCDVDPDSFTQSDLIKLENKLNNLGG